MTIREFWHDIRERLSDDHHPRREWRGPRREWRGPRREMDRGPYPGAWQDRDRARDQERWDLRERASGNRSRDSDDWGNERHLETASGTTSAAYDPGVWTGNTWSADERSSNWRGRQVDDYGQYAMGYWPEFYATPSAGSSFRGRGPQNWRRSDSRIREDICELMTDDEDLDPSEIEVQVQNGEVTLTGSVENRGDKRRAEDLAEHVSGVRDVHNRIQVQPRDTSLGTRDRLAGSAIGSTTRQ